MRILLLAAALLAATPALAADLPRDAVFNFRCATIFVIEADAARRAGDVEIAQRWNHLGESLAERQRLQLRDAGFADADIDAAAAQLALVAGLEYGGDTGPRMLADCGGGAAP